MNPYSLTLADLTEFFSSQKIEVAKVDFSEDPAFLAAEKANGKLLDHYASYVAQRPYDSEYLMKAKRVIDKMAPILQTELSKAGAISSCVDVAGIVWRMLNELGVWSCPILGALTVQYPFKSSLLPQHFHGFDMRQMTAGHAWLYAPPYKIVDLTVKLQPFSKKEAGYVPRCILTEHGKKILPTLEDLVSPEAREHMTRAGIPAPMQLQRINTNVSMVGTFPSLEVPALKGASLQYFPLACGGPKEKLNELPPMRAGGLVPGEVFANKILPKLTGILKM